MKLKTTIHLTAEKHARITAASLRLGRSKSSIARELIRCLYLHDQGPRIRGVVQYQESREKSKWHPLPVSLTPEEYNCLFDMRTNMKLSYSMLLTRAIDKYLDTLSETEGLTEAMLLHH